MSVREVVVLGTAGQAPTWHRNHNGYLLHWDGAGLLFDPGGRLDDQQVGALGERVVAVPPREAPL